MHLTIVLAMLAVIFAVELSPNVELPDGEWRMMIVMIIIVSNACLVMLQSGQIVRLAKSGSRDATINDSIARRERFFTGVWVGSVLAILFVVRWPQFVRQNLGLGNWLLLDELLILTPIFLPLLVAWFVFTGWESGQPASNHFYAERLNREKRRTGMFLNRLRLQLLLVLAPSLIFFALRDASRMFHGDQQAGVACHLLLLALPLGVLIAMPLCVRMLFRSNSILDTELGRQQIENLRTVGVKINDIRVWWTRNQIVNAVVVGGLPGFRQLYFSDGLIRSFNSRQLDAITRHEAAHLKRHHVVGRFLILLLPVNLLVSWQLLAASLNGSQFQFASGPTGIPAISELWLLAGFAVYGMLSLALASRLFEYEADVTACCRTETGTSELTVDESLLSDYLSMLHTMRPLTSRRITWLHPKIDSRIDLLERIGQNPIVANRMLVKTRWFAKVVLTVNLAALTAGVLAWWIVM